MQFRELRQRNDRFRESSELVAVEVELLLRATSSASARRRCARCSARGAVRSGAAVVHPTLLAAPFSRRPFETRRQPIVGGLLVRLVRAEKEKLADKRRSADRPGPWHGLRRSHQMALTQNTRSTGTSGPARVKRSACLIELTQ